MDMSTSNMQLWNIIIQFGIIGAGLLLATILRRKIPLFRKALMPTAVLAGLVALVLRILIKNVFTLEIIDADFMSALTYHMIAIGFIALSLRTPRKDTRYDGLAKKSDAANSGMLIASTYLLQAIIGLAVTIPLGLTLFPQLFPASGMLLPLGFGQGPGQAGNIGSTYEALGFAGGKSFGLAIATIGFLWACLGGVAYLIYLKSKGVKVGGGAFTEDEHEPAIVEGDIPLTDTVDKFSIQMAIVLFVYLVTYLVTAGLSWLFNNVSFLQGIAGTAVPLLLGFNFLLGTVFALLLKGMFGRFRKWRVMEHNYLNNFLLNRISGFAFDIMIFAGISSIEIGDIEGLWVPLLVMTTIGGLASMFYIRFACNRLYKGYENEAMMSMYGTLTGVISSGMILLREVDPDLKTPATNNQILGATTAILFGAPILVVVGLAPKSLNMLFVSLGLIVVYFIVLNILMFRKRKNNK